MGNFILGIIVGILIGLLLTYIMGTMDNRKLKKEFGENYDVRIKQPKKDIQHNVTICMHDDEYTVEHLDKDKNIIAFLNFHPNNIKSADFYYLLFENNQIITIDYEYEEQQIYYNAVITQIKLINEDTLRIYYTVLNKYKKEE